MARWNDIHQPPALTAGGSMNGIRSPSPDRLTISPGQHPGVDRTRIEPFIVATLTGIPTVAVGPTQVVDLSCCATAMFAPRCSRSSSQIASGGARRSHGPRLDRVRPHVPVEDLFARNRGVWRLGPRADWPTTSTTRCGSTSNTPNTSRTCARSCSGCWRSPT
jgi:hypothetical protein